MFQRMNLYSKANSHNLKKRQTINNIHLNNVSFLHATIARASLTTLSAFLFLGSAQAAEWGQSGKGGDGGYAWVGQQQGDSGKLSIGGKGGDGGEGGATVGSAYRPGSGGNIGSSDPDLQTGITGENGTEPLLPASCIPDGQTGKDSCGKGGTGGGGGGAGLSLDQQNSESRGDITGGNGSGGGSTIWNPGGGGEGGAGGAGVHLSGGDFHNNNILSGGNGGEGGAGGTSGSGPDFDTTLCKPGQTCYSGRGGGWRCRR